MSDRSTPSGPSRPVVIIGAGPAGLFAAEHLAGIGHQVAVYDRMPSVARKLLMAGRGGLNLTHSEPMDRFLLRYGAAADWLHPMLAGFGPEDLRRWAQGLGQETFVGSSGRVFPRAMKASPLLRAWLARLDRLGVTLHLRHDWQGWGPDGALTFATPEGPVTISPAATLLALGGASWPRLGSDGRWTAALAGQGVAVTPWQPANAGVICGWSARLADRFAGQPLKNISLGCAGQTARGEMILTRQGLEGGAIYALSAAIRSALAASPDLVLACDLKPDLSSGELAARLARARPGDTLSNRLRKAGLAAPAVALMQEVAARTGESLSGAAPEQLASRAKALPIRITGSAGLERAISSAGGMALAELDERLMIRRLPGTFAAGEMLDWDAPTGGYLLQASFATGLHAARGLAQWLAAGSGHNPRSDPA